MILDREILTIFKTFLKTTFGVNLDLYEEKNHDEYGRFFFGSRLYVLRDHGPTSEEAQTIEVFCSNPQELASFEQTWSAYLRTYFKLDEETEDDGEDPNTSDNGESV